MAPFLFFSFFIFSIFPLFHSDGYFPLAMHVLNTWVRRCAIVLGIAFHIQDVSPSGPVAGFPPFLLLRLMTDSSSSIVTSDPSGDSCH